MSAWKVILFLDRNLGPRQKLHRTWPATNNVWPSMRPRKENERRFALARASRC
jgi:hypothetical protein